MSTRQPAIMFVFLFSVAMSIHAQVDFLELVRTGGPEEIAAAIASGANVNDRTATARSALDYAVGTIDEQFENMSTLMLAASNNRNPEIISLLLRNGLRLQDRSATGWTALMYAAAFNGNPEVAARLLKEGARVGDRTATGESPLLYAAWYNGNPGMIGVLLKAGARIDERNSKGMTALMLAATSNGESEVLSALIAAGSDVDDTNIHSMDALLLAAKNSKNQEVLKVLLDAGAYLYARAENGTNVLGYMKLNDALCKSDLYWKLVDMSYNGEEWKRVYKPRSMKPLAPTKTPVKIAAGPIVTDMQTLSEYKDQQNIPFRIIDASIAFMLASSTLKPGKTVDYEYANLFDGNPATVWCEGAKGRGIGEWLHMEILNDPPDELCGYIYSMGFVNGYCDKDGRAGTRYYENSRIKRCLVVLSDGSATELSLSDRPGTQGFLVDAVTTSIDITIVEVYPGSKYEDSCLAELLIFGY